MIRACWRSACRPQAPTHEGARTFDPRRTPGRSCLLRALGTADWRLLACCGRSRDQPSDLRFRTDGLVGGELVSCFASRAPWVRVPSAPLQVRACFRKLTVCQTVTPVPTTCPPIDPLPTRKGSRSRWPGRSHRRLLVHEGLEAGRPIVCTKPASPIARTGPLSGHGMRRPAAVRVRMPPRMGLEPGLSHPEPWRPESKNKRLSRHVVVPWGP